MFCKEVLIHFLDELKDDFLKKNQEIKVSLQEDFSRISFHIIIDEISKKEKGRIQEKFQKVMFNRLLNKPLETPLRF